MDDILLDVQGVSHCFRLGRNSVLRALDGVSFQLRRGEIFGLVGESGSGKSTFLRCLNLLETPTKGKITFEGTEITSPKVKIDAVRQQMGMVFQHFNLFPNMTIRKNITLAPVRTGLMKQEEADAQADALLQRVGLTDKADAYPSQLSGGQKQRVAIARALIHRRSILLVDEGTSALDQKNADIVEKSLLANPDLTLILISHHLTDERRSMFDKVYDLP